MARNNDFNERIANVKVVRVWRKQGKIKYHSSSKITACRYVIELWYNIYNTEVSKVIWKQVKEFLSEKKMRHAREKIYVAKESENRASS